MRRPRLYSADMKTLSHTHSTRRSALIGAALIPLFIIGCSSASTADPTQNETAQIVSSKAQAPFTPATDKGEAIFAGGCFWCTESDFEKLPGVIEAISGYTGGRVDNPTYKQVSYTETGHFEAVKVIFDPEKVTYRELVDHYWRTIDPTDELGQFCDKGSSYRSAVFPTPEQAQDAKQSKAALIESGIIAQPIVTQILEAKTFYPAEAYHQDYYKRNPVRYKYYRNGCGRDKRLAELWGKK